MISHMKSISKYINLSNMGMLSTTLERDIWEETKLQFNEVTTVSTL
jgi:hypothetical protein